jgi:hypothetical protein
MQCVFTLPGFIGIEPIGGIEYFFAHHLLSLKVES